MGKYSFSRLFAVSLAAILTLALAASGCSLREGSIGVTALPIEVEADLRPVCDISTFVVNKVSDTNDGACTVEDCSLREAVVAANGCLGEDTIELSADSYLYELVGTPSYPSEVGPLEITDHLTIAGNGADASVVPFVISGSDTEVSIGDMGMKSLTNHGLITLSQVATEHIDNTGTLTGTEVDVVDGTGIVNRGTLRLTGGNIQRNAIPGRITSSMRRWTVRIVSNLGGRLELNGTTVADNRSVDQYEGEFIPVSAIGNDSGDVFLNDVIIRDNNTPEIGVGHALITSGDDSTNTVLNRVSISGHQGFAILHAQGRLQIIDGAIIDNPGPAILFNIEGHGTLLGTVVARNGNVDSSWPGVCSTIENQGPSMFIENSTLSGNGEPASGCAVIKNWGLLELVNVTLFDNRSPGIENGTGWGSPDTQLQRSILASNDGDNCLNPGTSSLGHNLFDDSTCGPDVGLGDIVDTSGALGVLPLADNGGPTETHALEPGSPAIDSGGPRCHAQDQRGVARPVGGGCDIGAYEASFGLTGEEPDAGDVIELNFNADLYTIERGECTNLRWQVSGADSITLLGVEVGELGTRQVCPSQRTGYELFAQNASEEASSYLEIAVVDPQDDGPQKGCEVWDSNSNSYVCQVPCQQQFPEQYPVCYK